MKTRSLNNQPITITTYEDAKAFVRTTLLKQGKSMPFDLSDEEPVLALVAINATEQLRDKLEKLGASDAVLDEALESSFLMQMVLIQLYRIGMRRHLKDSIEPN